MNSITLSRHTFSLSRVGWALSCRPLELISDSMAQRIVYAVDYSAGFVRALDYESGQIIKEMKTPFLPNRCSLSPDNSLLAVSTDGAPAAVLDAETLETVSMLEARSRSVAFSPSGDLIAVSGEGSCNVILFGVPSFLKLREGAGHTQASRSISFTPSGSTLVSASDDHTARVWEVESMMCIRTLSGPSGLYSILCISEDVAIIGSDNGNIDKWDIQGGQVITAHKFDNWSYVGGITYIPESDLIVTASFDGKVRVFDLDTFACVRTITCDGDCTRCVYAVDEDHVVVGADYNRPRAINVKTGETTQYYPAHTGWIPGITISAIPKALTLPPIII